MTEYYIVSYAVIWYNIVLYSSVLIATVSFNKVWNLDIICIHDTIQYCIQPHINKQNIIKIKTMIFI